MASLGFFYNRRNSLLFVFHTPDCSFLEITVLLLQSSGSWPILTSRQDDPCGKINHTCFLIVPWITYKLSRYNTPAHEWTIKWSLHFCPGALLQVNPALPLTLWRFTKRSRLSCEEQASTDLSRIFKKCMVKLAELCMICWCRSSFVISFSFLYILM